MPYTRVYISTKDGVESLNSSHTLRDRSRRCVIAESLGLGKVGPGRTAARISSAADPEYTADYSPRAHPHVGLYCGPRTNPRKPPHIAGV